MKRNADSWMPLMMTLTSLDQTNDADDPPIIPAYDIYPLNLGLLLSAHTDNLITSHSSH